MQCWCLMRLPRWTGMASPPGPLDGLQTGRYYTRGISSSSVASPTSRRICVMPLEAKGCAFERELISQAGRGMRGACWSSGPRGTSFQPPYLRNAPEHSPRWGDAPFATDDLYSQIWIQIWIQIAT